MARVVRSSFLCITVPAAGLPAPAAEPWWSDEDGDGGVEPAATRAELDLGTLAAGDLDTVIEAVDLGPDGNDLTVLAIGDSAAGAGVVIGVGASNDDLEIHYESGVSTVDNVVAAIAALTGRMARIRVKTAGTGATVLAAPGDDFVATSLAGGQNHGHNVSGLHVDAAIVTVKVSVWNALADLQVLCQRSPAPDGSGAYAWTEVPFALLVAAVGTGNGTALRFDIGGAKRVRFGLRANDAGAVVTFAATARVEFIREHTTL